MISKSPLAVVDVFHRKYEPKDDNKKEGVVTLHHKGLVVLKRHGLSSWMKCHLNVRYEHVEVASYEILLSSVSRLGIYYPANRGT